MKRTPDARTMGPDGKIAEFTGQVYDREIVKARKIRVNAKVLTLGCATYKWKSRGPAILPVVFKLAI